MYWVVFFSSSNAGTFLCRVSFFCFLLYKTFNRKYICWKTWLAFLHIANNQPPYKSIFFDSSTKNEKILTPKYFIFITFCQTWIVLTSVSKIPIERWYPHVRRCYLRLQVRNGSHMIKMFYFVSRSTKNDYLILSLFWMNLR